MFDQPIFNANYMSSLAIVVLLMTTEAVLVRQGMEPIKNIYIQLAIEPCTHIQVLSHNRISTLCDIVHTNGKSWH